MITGKLCSRGEVGCAAFVWEGGRGMSDMIQTERSISRQIMRALPMSPGFGGCIIACAAALLIRVVVCFESTGSYFQGAGIWFQRWVASLVMEKKECGLRSRRGTDVSYELEAPPREIYLDTRPTLAREMPGI